MNDNLDAHRVFLKFKLIWFCNRLSALQILLIDLRYKHAQKTGLFLNFNSIYMSYYLIKKYASGCQKIIINKMLFFYFFIFW